MGDPDMCAMVLEPPKRLEGCKHSETAILGFDGNAEFLRCHACNRILVSQAGRFWILRPKA